MIIENINFSQIFFHSSDNMKFQSLATIVSCIKVGSCGLMNIYKVTYMKLKVRFIKFYFPAILLLER